LYDPGTGKVERYPWSSVRTDKFALLIGRRLLPLARPSGLRQITMFPAEGLRTLILPRLPAASFVSHARLQLSALLRGNASLCVVAVGFSSLITLQLLRRLHPEWFKAAGAVLWQWLRTHAS
jgi:hypothetical protein